jgi:hypothetical protein
MDESNPFTLDQDTKKCILRCKPGYWVENSDCNSEYIKPDGTVICKNVDQDPLKQSCVNDNCKSWKDQPDACTKCWDNYDLAHYDSWLGRGSYPEDNIKDAVTEKPFVLEAGKCKLKCKDGYYTAVTNDGLAQKCVKCKDPCHHCETTESNCTWCGETGF